MDWRPNSRHTPWKATLGLSIPTLLFVAIACEKERQPCRYLIPDGYVGWVLIEFNVEGARPLREEDGYLVFKIPSSGRLAIPGESEYGWARDEYYYVHEQGSLEELPITAPGGGGLIWGEGIGSHFEQGFPEFSAEHFFVGPETEFERAPKITEVMRLRAVQADERAPR